MKMLVDEEVVHPIFREICKRRNEGPAQVRNGLIVLITFIEAVRGVYYPLTVSKTFQANRFRQPLFEPVSLDSIDHIFNVSLFC